MVATDGDWVLLAYRSDRLFQCRSIINEIAEDQKLVVEHFDGFEIIDVGVNIRQN